MDHAMFIVLAVITVAVAIKNEKDLIASGISKKEKQEIIEQHNACRLQLANGKVKEQPRASNMKQLCWDDVLAEKAQNIANDMSFKHQNVDDDRWSKVGQNLGLHFSTDNNNHSNWTAAITSWFNEVAQYRFGDEPKRNTGHYIQLAWAITTHVGCGYTYFINPNNTMKYTKLYVCNYGPGGNLLGKNPYKTELRGCRGLCETQCNLSNKN